MARTDYDSNSLIGKYISACARAKQPLSINQIGLLERTLSADSNMDDGRPAILNAFTPLDENTLKTVADRRHMYFGRMLNILKKYSVSNRGMSSAVAITEADMFSLYTLTASEIEATTFKELKGQHDLPKTYGFVSYAVMHEYFVKKGIIREGHMPKPLKFPNC